MNFAWSVLVSLHLYLQNNPQPDVQQHIHIMKWLRTARKRCLFPKAHAAEMDWFIAEGRRKGVCAGLRARAEYIWHTGTGNTQRHSDLRRLSFFEAANGMGWHEVLVSDANWLHLCDKTPALPTLYLQKNSFSSPSMRVKGCCIRLRCG